MLDYLIENGIKSVVFWIVGIGAFFLLNASGALPHASVSDAKFPHVSADKWQAVFLSNNQVYFGKLKDDGGEYVSLSHVYYLRAASDLASGGSLNLIKLGGELHGPEDEMHIAKASILFWEEMKDSSRVVQSIVSAKP